MRAGISTSGERELDHKTNKTAEMRHAGQEPKSASSKTEEGPARQSSKDTSKAAATVLAQVIAEVLPNYSVESPPPPSAELYADLFIDSRRFLMIVRGLERTLCLEIDDEDLLGVDLITYADLLKFVSGLASTSRNPRHENG